MATARNGASVVVLGGGFGGLEAAFHLRSVLDRRHEITLVSDRDAFVFKPNTIYIPFGLEPERLLIPLEKPLRKKGIFFVQSQVREIDPEARRVATANGDLAYDQLIVAVGAEMAPERVPGLAEHAISVFTTEGLLEMRRALQDSLDRTRRGGRAKVVFLVPPGNKCSGPLYELVFMTETWLEREGGRDRVELSFVTAEEYYLRTFGPKVRDLVIGEFERRGIEGHIGAVREVTEEAVILEDGSILESDVVITFPPYRGPELAASLPHDEQGFIRTDLASRRVVGLESVYAVGDAADFPVKQGFLAFLQGEAAAEHVASALTGKAPERDFAPLTMCIMEMGDDATFARRSLTDEGQSVYDVGMHPMWRVGKKLLGLYLPFRFRRGNPFHHGMPWAVMEKGLAVFSGAFAEDCSGRRDEVAREPEAA